MKNLLTLKRIDLYKEEMRKHVDPHKQDTYKNIELKRCCSFSPK